MFNKENKRVDELQDTHAILNMMLRANRRFKLNPIFQDLVKIILAGYHHPKLYPFPAVLEYPVPKYDREQLELLVM